VQPRKKEKNVHLSHHDTKVCSLMCGPLAIVGTSPFIGHEQRCLHIGHSEGFFKDYVW
jgi:hypothetical protein